MTIPTPLLGSSETPSESYQEFLNLSQKFLGVEHSTLQSGMFGYMTASMSKAASDAAIQRDILYGEHFLNTAETRGAISNFAMLYDYNVSQAIPSFCQVLIGIPLEELKTSIGQSVGTFTIPRGQELFLDDVPFVLAGAIDIKVEEGDQVTASYNSRQMLFPRELLFLRTSPINEVTGVGGSRRVEYVEAHAHQARIHIREFQLTDTGFDRRLEFEVNAPAGEQISTFKVFYAPPSDSIGREIPSFFNNTTEPDEREYCFYFAEPSKLTVYFSRVPGSFAPAFNSRIRIEYTTTRGLAGNIEFLGLPGMTITGEDGRKIIPLTRMLFPNASGGKDAESLRNVKEGIIRRNLSRDSVINEIDLNNYLDDIIQRDVVGDSFIEFIRSRDDVILRLYHSFLLMLDSNNLVIPSNTADLTLDIIDVQEKNFRLEVGDFIVYDANSKKFRLLADDEFPETYLNNVNQFIYCIPELIQIYQFPFSRAVAYRTSVNTTVGLKLERGDYATQDNFSSSFMTVYRSAALSKQYVIETLIISNVENDILSDAIRVVGIIKNPRDNDNVIGYFRPQIEPGTNLLRARLTTDDTFTETDPNEIKIVGGLFPDEMSAVNHSLVRQNPDNYKPDGNILQSLPSYCNIEYRIYYDTGSGNSDYRTIKEEDRTFQFVRSLETTEPLSIYKALTDVSDLQLEISPEGVFTLKNVPLVGAQYFLGNRTGLEYIRINTSYLEALEEVLPRLVNNTAISLKLMNTYGPSTLFTGSRVNISIKLEVSTKGTGVIEGLKERIIQAVNTFLINVNKTTTKRFSYSNLATYLEQQFFEIAYTRLVSINGSQNQVIQLTSFSQLEEQQNEQVPEFLCCNLRRDQTSQGALLVPDVDIKFV